jgi:hypothetical protein
MLTRALVATAAKKVVKGENLAGKGVPGDSAKNRAR